MDFYIHMILNLFLFWRIGLFLITFLGSLAFPLNPNGGIGAISQNTGFNFLNSWAQWDGGHYFQIATSGYSGEDVVFFPLFPLITKALSFIFFGNIVLAGLTLSSVLFFLFLKIFGSYVKHTASKNISSATIITYLLFPTAYFAVAFYSEAIFLLLMSLTLIFLHKKKIFFSSLFAGLAAASRISGIFLTVLIAAELFKEIVINPRKNWYKASYLAVSLSGIIAYSLFLLYKFKNPFLFLTYQKEWGRNFVNPANTIFNLIKNILSPNTFAGYIDSAVTITFLVLLIISYKKIKRSHFIYTAIVLLAPLSTGTLTSMPRYVLAAFPIFILIGKFLSKKEKLRIIVWGAFLLLQLALIVMFVNGYWTA